MAEGENSNPDVEAEEEEPKEDEADKGKEEEEKKKKEEEEEEDEEDENTSESPTERIVAGAVSAVAAGDAKDPLISSDAVKKPKEFFKRFQESRTGAAVGITVAIITKIVSGIFEFAKVAAKNKGKIGFSKGYEIGKKLSDFEDKKDKKGK